MAQRKCDSCTACCEGWLSSTTVKMSPGSPCQHCTARGCAIYESRPQEPCRNFECAWLQQGSQLPDDFRPDVCGAIVMLDRKWHGREVIRAFPTGEDIPAPTLEWIKGMAVKTGLPLLYEKHEFNDGVFARTKILGFGPPEFVQAVKDTIRPGDIFTL